MQGFLTNFALIFICSVMNQLNPEALADEEVNTH